MDFNTLELDGNKYPLEKPIDFLLNWAMEASADEFKSKESLDKIAKVIKAVCPSVPNDYFYGLDAQYTIPLIDSYLIIDFVAKLMVCVIERRIQVIESIPEDQRASLKIDVKEKVALFRQAVDKISKQFSDLRFNLILGGIQVSTKEAPVSPSFQNEPKIMALKQQVEALSSEIASLEKATV
jgi:hypothetical protein